MNRSLPQVIRNCGRSLSRHSAGIYLFGLFFPFVVLVAEVLFEKVLGIVFPTPSRREFLSVLATGVILTTLGSLFSDLRLWQRIVTTALTVFLFPVLFVACVLLLIVVFGMEAP